MHIKCTRRGNKDNAKRIPWTNLHVCCFQIEMIIRNNIQSSMCEIIWCQQRHDVHRQVYDKIAFILLYTAKHSQIKIYTVCCLCDWHRYSRSFALRMRRARCTHTRTRNLRRQLFGDLGATQVYMFPGVEHTYTSSKAWSRFAISMNDTWSDVTYERTYRMSEHVWV